MGSLHNIKYDVKALKVCSEFLALVNFEWFASFNSSLYTVMILLFFLYVHCEYLEKEVVFSEIFVFFWI